MPRGTRLLVALFVLLPFKVVAQITLAAAAVIFFWQPFELSRLYALVAVSIVQMLARLHRWMETQRAEQESEHLAPVLAQLDRYSGLVRVTYHLWRVAAFEHLVHEKLVLLCHHDLLNLHSRAGAYIRASRRDRVQSRLVVRD